MHHVFSDESEDVQNEGSVLADSRTASVSSFDADGTDRREESMDSVVSEV